MVNKYELLAGFMVLGAIILFWVSYLRFKIKRKGREKEANSSLNIDIE